MKRKAPFILLILSLTLLFIGLKQGDYGTVLEKAVTICLSCIGIG